MNSPRLTNSDQTVRRHQASALSAHRVKPGDYLMESCQAKTMFYCDVQTCWLLLMALLFRPHNLSLLLMVAIQQLCVSWTVKELRLPAWADTLAYLWMGQAAFYYQVKAMANKKHVMCPNMWKLSACVIILIHILTSSDSFQKLSSVEKKLKFSNHLCKPLSFQFL